MPEENKEEKLEFLKRGEIRTMGKDIRKLREIEAQIEKEKIAEIKETEKEKIAPVKTEGEKVEAEVKPEIPTPEIKFPEAKAPEVKVVETLIPLPNPPKKPMALKKVLIRVLIACVLLLILVVSFRFISERLSQKEGISPPEEGEIVPPIEITVPLPLFSVEETKIFEISKNEEIPGIYNQLLNEELALGSFTRIVIKNLSEKRLVFLKEISQAFQIEVPEEAFEKLEENFTFSIYSQKEGKRIALIVKAKDKEGLNEILQNWENKIEKDGVSVSGNKIKTIASLFRTTSYQNISFRYLTVSKEDVGICYLGISDYFILTTSFESTYKVIPKITQEIRNKIGQLFIVGFEGKTITAQLEEFFKKYKPGGVLLLSKNIESKEQLTNLTSGLQSLSLKETGFPLLISVDQEGDPISRIGFLEEKTSQSKIESNQSAYQIGQNRGKELKDLGVNLNLAPFLDDMKSGDYYYNRSFQTSTEISGELAKSLVSGQKEAKILTAIKHFPGYFGISFNSEEKLANVEKVPEISQFKKANEAKPEFVMTSNVIYKEIDSSLPFTFSPQAVKFLKDNLGSEILIISDDLSQNSLLKKFYLKDLVQKPIQAGVDILIFSGYRLPVEQGLDAAFNAVLNAEISGTKIDEAFSRIIQLKQNL